MTETKLAFDAQRLRMLLDPEVRRTLLAPGALEGLVMVLHVADLFRSALVRLGAPPDLLDRSAKAATHADAAAALRAFLETPRESPAPVAEGVAVMESSP